MGVDLEPRVRTNGDGKAAPMLASWLAYLYAPILPYLKKVKIVRQGRRAHNPEDILLPEGYQADVVATGLTAPVHCCFDDQGKCYVTESGHKVESRPRIVQVDLETGDRTTVFELPEDRWIQTGALTGACWHKGYLYFTNTNTLSRQRPDGEIEDIVTDLPGLGDHQTNHPIVGPDGKIYFGQGSVTNTGIVGADNFAYEWLAKYPQVHDVPGEDVTLVGRNYEYRNILGDLRETVRTGAYVPFGTETQPGQVIKGSVKCNGAILRCNSNGRNLEVVAWGLRNPYGIAFDADGRLFATEHGIDERSRRYIVGDPEDLYQIVQGAWYGWPDFASGIRLDDPHWGEGGHGREPVLAAHPDPDPPKPFVSFPAHAAPNGFDFCRNDTFGFKGDAFVALFGDAAPVTGRPMTPRGFKVVRVDVQNRRVVDFAVNKIAGPASQLPHGGLERPSHCAFGPDGALYIVDWGEIDIAPETGGIRMPTGTGTLWRIRRTAGPSGDRPPEPIVVPTRAIQLVLFGVIGILASLGAIWLLERRRR